MVLSHAVLRLAALGTAGILSIAGSAIAQLPMPQPKHVPSPPARTATFSNPAKASTNGKAGDRGLQNAVVPTEKYDHGDPTNDEQLMLEMVNRARANPTAEGEMLASTDDPDVGFAYDYFNINRNKLRTDFATYPKRPPLALNKSLLAAARRHSRDMNTNNFQDHTGSDNSQFFERMTSAGYGFGTNSGENISAYSNSVFYGHVGLNVDWGTENQLELGHRNNIMNFRDFQYTEIGIGIIENDRSLPNTGPFIITQDFGRASSPFIVGVVYRDQNSNNFYDPGEGLGGVTIMPSAGQYYAVTSSSGGYAIPCPKSGSWSLTASGGGLPSETTVNVSFNDENIKVDFRPNMGSFPAAVALNLPANNATIAADSVQLSWKAPTGTITTYHLQVSTDINFENDIIVNDSTLTGITTKVKGLHNQEYYYWRVRAKNSAGWGVFGEKRLIEVAMTPMAIVLNSPTNGAQVSPGSVQFRWNELPATQGVIERYWFEFGSDPLMSVVDMRDTLVTDPWMTVNNLDRNRTYYWRVKAMNSIGWGAFSPIWNVQTTSSGVTRESANALFRLSASTPNPFSGSTTISFELARPEHVTLTVLDNLGREVAVLASERQGAGYHEVHWNADGAANGVYFYQLKAGEFTETRTMILAR